MLSRSATRSPALTQIDADTTETSMTKNAQKLLDLLKNGHPHRVVYRARDDGWFVTFGGGETTAEAVEELRQLDLISSVCNNCLDEAYHVGKTLDIVATMEERKKHRRGKSAPLIYTDGSRELRSKPR